MSKRGKVHGLGGVYCVRNNFYLTKVGKRVVRRSEKEGKAQQCLCYCDVIAYHNSVRDITFLSLLASHADKTMRCVLEGC